MVKLTVRVFTPVIPPSNFTLKNFKPTEKSQQEYNERAYIIHLDSSVDPILSRLPLSLHIHKYLKRVYFFGLNI